ncbi:MAG: hypothetical protein IKL00_08335 [Oscillospiraceae bacterium]|nr:hypothetical protein [Oscillospiraceae bacterium]
MAENMDIVRLRQLRLRRKRLLKLLLGLLAVTACIIVYVKRDVWFPKLEGIGTKYQNITQNKNADTEGNYPLSVSGGVDYYTSFVGNHMFILCDMYLYIYSADGDQKDSRQHAYSNAVMQTSGSRCLLYSCNGTKFRVDTANKMLFENTLEQPILFARIGKNGYTAVVTESETYASRLCIFDANGKSVYNRDCVDRLVDVTLYDGGCVFATLGAENGEITTTLQSVTFNGDHVVWASSPMPTLCMNIYALSDGGAMVIGDSSCAYYSSTGALLYSYDYTGELLDYTYSDEKAAILVKNEEQRQSQLLLFYKIAAQPAQVSIPYIAKSVEIDDETAYILGIHSIDGYAFNGNQTSQLEMTDSYERIMKNGKYFYLLGYDKINRINANGS